MINKIKVEYCKVVKDIFGNSNYMPVDITMNTEIPILEKLNIDDELDSTMLKILVRSDTPSPFEPTTRFIIRINEVEEIKHEPQFDDSWKVLNSEAEDKTYVWAIQNVKGYKKIYSYVRDVKNKIISKLNKQYVLYKILDYDNPVQVIYGKKPIYEHSISLIEPTKILERQDIDNETITNTIIANEIDTIKNTVEYNVITREGNVPWYGSVFDTYNRSGFKDYGYVGNDRFKQPYLSGDSISLNVRLNIHGLKGHYKLYTKPYLYEDITWVDNCTLSLTKMTINGQNVTNRSSYLFPKAGTYIIIQTYEGTNGNWNYKYEVSWTISVWERGSSYIRKKTISDVIDKLLSTNPLRREGVDAKEYEFDGQLREKLNQYPAPEFSFSFSHLLDGLNQVASFIHAETRLIPNEYIETDQNNNIVLNDWQIWNIISFDFLGSYEVFKQNKPIKEESYWSIGDYATNFVTNVENALQTNFRSYTSMVEPFIGGFISPRTESADYILTDDNCIIRTTLPIYRILSFKILINGSATEKVNNIVEKHKYDTLSSYNGRIDSKTQYLFYTKGSNIIDGLNFEADTAIKLEDQLGDKRTIKNITGYDGNIKDLAFQVTYIPYRKFKARLYKPLIRDNKDSTLIYNQQANIVDMESYGENIKGTLLRTGNPVNTRTYYYKSFEDIPQLGTVTSDYSYWVYSLSIGIYNSVYKCEINLSKDFNKYNEYLGIKSDYRQWEISESESENRNPDYGEFCVLTTTPDTKEFEDNPDDFKDEKVYFLSQLNTLGFTNYAINQMKNKLNFINGEGLQGQQLSFVYIKTSSVEYDSEGNSKNITHEFLLPINCSSFGNSILINFKTQDNYSASTSLKNLSGAKGLEEYIEYGDSFGHIDSMSVAFGIGLPSTSFSAENSKEYSKKIYDFSGYTLDTSKLVVDIRDNNFWFDKDSRECIGLTYQLHFRTRNKNIQIGKAISEIWGFVGDNSSSLKVVEFYKMPNKFEAYVEENSFIASLYKKPVIFNSEYKRIEISPPEQSNQDNIGWGILTDDNRIVFAMIGYEKLYFEFRRKI